MKRLLYCMTLALLLTACYTTEENYKAAYDKAKERTRENMGGTIYDMSQAERVLHHRDNQWRQCAPAPLVF